MPPLDNMYMYYYRQFCYCMHRDRYDHYDGLEIWLLFSLYLIMIYNVIVLAVRLCVP